MDFRHYSDNAAALAAELVNTYLSADAEDRPVEPAELTTLLEEHEVSGTVTADDVPRLRELADRLREIFAAPDAHTAAVAANRLLADSTAAPWVSEHDNLSPHLHFARPEAGLVERTAASTAVGVAIVLCDYGKERLGECASTTCDDVFIDTSRNAQRRYCSGGCANRSNVRAHRARQRDA